MVARVQPGRVAGVITAPPSKSVTHRAYLLAALSDAPATVAGPLRSDDTQATLAALHALGARTTFDGDTVRFEPAPLMPPLRALDCANSGTTLRLIAATAARLAQPVILTGDGSLRRRPNGGLIAALQTLGARVRSEQGRAPITLQGPLHAGHVPLPPGSSSQFASALLLALPFLEGESRLELRAPIASRPYVELTLAMAAQAGLRIETTPAADGGLSLAVGGLQSPRLGAYRVEADWSSAAFPLAAAALTAGAVQVNGLDAQSRQGDRAVVDHLRSFGAEVAVTRDAVTAQGPARLQSPGTVDVAANPDLFPVLAVLAAASRGTTTFIGGGSLRAKESDRIQAVAHGLAQMGISCQERPDGLVVVGGSLRGAHLASHGDHRIHMAFAVAALAAQGTTVIDDAESARVSYPAFHADLARLGARIETLAEATP